MDRKIWILCILAAVSMILLPISSVVGSYVIKSNNKDEFVNSPLFTIRNKSDNVIKSKFLGKESKLNLFNSNSLNLQKYIDKSLKLIEKNPNLLKSFLSSVYQIPEINDLMKQNNIDIDEFKKEINVIINNDDILKEKIDEALIISPFKDDPVPLGLSTSNPLGCFIVALVLLPIFALIGAIIATITIITCLNINSCFETLVQNMIDSFVQGLENPN